MARPLAPIKELRPAVTPRWDHGIYWGQIILDGNLPPVPAQCASERSGPDRVWPEVEGALGHGIGKRRARFLVVQGSAKHRHWTPPPWWYVESVEALTMTFHDDGSEAGMVPETVRMAKADPSAYVLRKHRALKFTVTIDGPEPGPDVWVQYYLEWRKLTGDPALRERLRGMQLASG
jgi:hypothetical protein